MGKLVGIVIVVTGLAVWLAVWLLPVYVLIAASVLVDPQDWREVKWSLRVAAFASGAIGVAAWHAHGTLIGEFVIPDFGQIAQTVAWTWAGGLGCAVVALIVGLGLRLSRQRNSKPRSGAT
jgi:hypothetical protein